MNEENRSQRLAREAGDAVSRIANAKDNSAILKGTAALALLSVIASIDSESLASKLLGLLRSIDK